MEHCGHRLAQRKSSNARALKSFGVNSNFSDSGSVLKTLREGNGISLYTIGYERRSGAEVISALLHAGVDILADVREKPFSRKADFRAQALSNACANAGLRYAPFTDLGSTETQREVLRETGDIDAFMKRFRTFVKRYRSAPLARLTTMVKRNVVAMICYERAHEDCHRSVLAELIAERANASIVAIV